MLQRAGSQKNASVRVNMHKDAVAKREPFARVLSRKQGEASGLGSCFRPLTDNLPTIPCRTITLRLTGSRHSSVPKEVECTRTKEENLRQDAHRNTQQGTQ